MIELTTSYQLIKQEYVGNAYGDVYVRCYAKYDERDIPNNRTKVTVASNLVCAGTWWAQSGNEWYAGASGLTTASGTAPSSYSPGEITLGTLTGWISHENDGKKNISVASGFVSTPWGFAKTASDTVKLPDIPRASKLTSATMSIANNQTTKVVLNMTKSVSTYYDNLIIKDGTTTVATINGVTNGGSGSTLSSAQANAVFNAIGTATSKTFTCYLQTKTSSSGSEVGTSSSVNLVATLPNYSISFTSSTVTDSVTTYDPYKPNTSTFIANLSKPKYEFSASSSTGYYYGRTLGYKIGSTSVTSPYTNNNYTGQSLTITASDGRKSVNTTPSMTHVAYFRPTLTTKVSRTTPTGSTADVTVNGTYYDGTNLTNLETPKLTFKYTERGGSEQEITIPLTTTTSGNVVSFTGTAQLTSLDYKKTVSWNSIISDILNITTTNTGTLVEGLPLWNGYKKNDTNYFNVNGNETISGQLIKSQAGQWIVDRDLAPVRNNNNGTSGYAPVVSIKTKDGNWTIGSYSDNNLKFVYTTDTNYNNKTNQSAVWNLGTGGGTINPYPVGSIYMSWDSTSPASLFGGTWTQLKNAFIFGINATTGNGTSGNGTGTSTGNVKLTASQSGLPKHYHDSLRWTTSTGNVFTANGGSVSGKFGLSWGSNTGQSANIVTSEAGGTSASDNHSHTVPYIAVFVWRRTA